MLSYKPIFDTYSDANSHSDSDLVTFVKSHSDLDEEKAALVVRTFKTLCKFGDFSGAQPTVSNDSESSSRDPEDSASGEKHQRRQSENSNSSGAVVINVNIALSVDATSDAAVYDAFFAAMAKHLKDLMNGGS